jgi:VWFA-related protein
MSGFTSITGLVVALGCTFLPDVLLPTSQPPRQAQAAPPVFRVAVNYVESDVVVRDSQTGQFVRSLHAEDFDVLEDGKPQQIATFALVDLSAGGGSPLAGHPAVVPGTTVSEVSSNDDAAQGRVYLLVLDDLHIEPRHAEAAKTIARAFIERHLAPHDIVAILSTSRDGQSNADFTTDHGSLIAAVDRFTGRKLFSPADRPVSCYG